MRDVLEAYVRAVQYILFACLVAMPLAVWKLIDLLLWIYRHLTIDWAD